MEASTVSALDYFNLRSDYLDLKEKNKKLEKELGVANATVYIQKETRDDLMKQIKGLKEIIADLEAGKGKLTFWQQLKELFGCN